MPPTALTRRPAPRPLAGLAAAAVLLLSGCAGQLTAATPTITVSPLPLTTPLPCGGADPGSPADLVVPVPAVRPG